MSTNGVSDEDGGKSKEGKEPETRRGSQQTTPRGSGEAADVVDLPAVQAGLPRPNRRKPRRSPGRTVMTSFPADDVIPTGIDDEGDPFYVATDLDRRWGALVERYDHSQPNPEFILVSDAFFAVTASENLAHADEAVAVLALLVARAKRRTYYLLSKQLEELEASGMPGPSGDGRGWRA